jgi:hypothetical protein
MEITSLSYSKIASLLRCARAFEYNYILKTPVALKGRLLAGRCYHHTLAAAALKKQLFNELITPEEVGNEFSDRWTMETDVKLVYDELGEEKIEATIIDYGDDDPGKLKDSGIELAKLYIATVLPGLEIEYIEKRLETDIEGIPFVGYIDLLVNSKGAEVVIDHKLAKRKMPQEDADKDIQLSAYAMLMGKPITGQFHQALDTKDKEIHIVETRRGEEDIKWFKELARGCWQVIQNGVFPPNPLSWTCSADGCAYWLDCRKGWF